jgi:SAM-dependent methyltransferase
MGGGKQLGKFETAISRGIAMLTDELFESLPGNGWLTRPEAELLYAEAERCSGAILEVGCCYGRSTILLASLGRPVVTIDPFAGYDKGDPSGDSIYQAFVGGLAERGITNVELIKKRLEDIELLLIPRCEFAYLDGDHTYQGTLTQVKRALSLGVKTIAVHDCNDTGEGANVKRAAMELLGTWYARAERLAVWRLK